MSGGEATFDELAAVIGRDDALRLCVLFGGTRLYFPHRMTADGQLARIFGIHQAQALSRAFGGLRLTIQAATTERCRERGELIRQLRRSGETVRNLALRYGMSERRIAMILKEEPI